MYYKHTVQDNICTALNASNYIQGFSDINIMGV